VKMMSLLRALSKSISATTRGCAYLVMPALPGNFGRSTSIDATLTTVVSNQTDAEAALAKHADGLCNLAQYTSDLGDRNVSRLPHLVTRSTTYFARSIKKNSRLQDRMQ
jgi:hypothetical protein